MDSVVPLLVAFIGALLGAYFAFIKTRKERLWQDRYEVLRDLILSLEIIQSHFESEHMEHLGLTVVVGEEKELLRNDFFKSRHDLRKNVAKLRLLFKERKIDKIVELHTDLNSAFFDLYQGTPPDHSEDCASIGTKAGEITEEVIKVAQKYY